MAVAVLNYLLIMAIWKFNKQRKQMVHPNTSAVKFTDRQQVQVNSIILRDQPAVIQHCCSKELGLWNNILKNNIGVFAVLLDSDNLQPNRDVFW